MGLSSKINNKMVKLDIFVINLCIFLCSWVDDVTLQALGSTRLTAPESSTPGNDNISHGSLLDDPTQKKPLCQKATPPPSPLLSELLKKGSILATKSRLV